VLSESVTTALNNSTSNRTLALDMADLVTPQTEIIFGDVDELGTRTTRVSKILVHPIKSCRGASVLEAKYTPEGLENDRKWSIISAETNRIITARESPKMILIAPRIELDPSLPYSGRLKVSFPEDSGCESFSVPLNPDEELLKTWEILDNIDLFTYRNIDGYICQAFPSPLKSQTASSILSKYFERPVHLVFKGPRARTCQPTLDFPNLDASLHYQDGYPLLILSEESVKAAEREVRGYVGVQGVGENWKDDKLVVERFRPNIVLKGGGPFAEDMWEEISFDEPDTRVEPVEIKLVSKCVRCLLPNVHPETGVRDKAVPFKVLMKFRSNVDARLKMKPCFGVYGVPSRPGMVKVGDWVHVKKLFPV